MLITRVDHLRERFGWIPRRDDLDFIVRTALQRERKLPQLTRPLHDHATLGR